MPFWNNLWALMVTQRSATEKNYLHAKDKRVEIENMFNIMVVTEQSVRRKINESESDP